MDPKTFMCRKCGGQKSIFLLRKPWLLLASILIGMSVMLMTGFMQESAARSIVRFLGLAIAGSLAVILLAVRCLACEPQWNSQRWLGLN
jgi:hypothetical protein